MYKPVYKLIITYKPIYKPVYKLIITCKPVNKLIITQNPSVFTYLN